MLQPVMPSCDPGPAPACLPAKTFRSYLPRCHRTYSCVHCRAHLAKHDELISKVGRQGVLVGHFAGRRREDSGVGV